MRDQYLKVRIFAARCGLLALAILFPVACGLDQEPAPDQVGPSEQGISVEFVALPDTLNADGGRSFSVVRLVLRDPSGRPLPSRALLFHHDGDGELVPAPGATYVGPVQDPRSSVMATDSNGTVLMHYLSGTQRERRVWIDVRPYGTDTSLQIDLPFRGVEIWQK